MWISVSMFFLFFFLNENTQSQGSIVIDSHRSPTKSPDQIGNPIRSSWYEFAEGIVVENQCKIIYIQELKIS